jgi:hypothetical protein
MMPLAQEYDIMYREGHDGMIGVKQSQEGGRLEMITIIDISNMLNFDFEAAKELGRRLYEL